VQTISKTILLFDKKIKRVFIFVLINWRKLTKLSLHLKLISIVTSWFFLVSGSMFAKLYIYLLVTLGFAYFLSYLNLSFSLAEGMYGVLVLSFLNFSWLIIRIFLDLGVRVFIFLFNASSLGLRFSFFFLLPLFDFKALWVRKWMNQRWWLCVDLWLHSFILNIFIMMMEIII